MSAFGATAEDVTAFAGSVLGTTIEIGSDAVAFASLEMRLAAGVRIAPPADAMLLLAGAPRLAAGKRVTIPPGAMTWAHGRAVFSLSAFVSIPPASMAWSGYTPVLRSGASARIPAGALSEVDVPITLRAGKRIGLPANLMSEMGGPVRPSAGKREELPSTDLTLTDKTSRVLVGNRISINNSVSGEYTIDATAEDATAEHGSLIGEPTLLTRRVPDVVNWADLQLRVSSGGSGMIPVDPTTINEQRLEIGARRRKLRVWSIAS